MKEPSSFTPSSPGLSQLFDAIFERMLRMPGMFDNDDMRVLEKVQDVLAQPDDWMGEVGEIAIQLRSSGFAVVDGPILKSLIPVIQRAASSEKKASSCNRCGGLGYVLSTNGIGEQSKMPCVCPSATRGNYDPNESPEQLASRLAKIESFVGACERSDDKKTPRLLTPAELASAPKTQALMVELIDRPEKAAEKVKGEVPQLQAGITALFEALSECGIHAARLERELATAKRQACTSEHRTTCSFASSAIGAPETAVRNALFSNDLYSVLMDVQNGIDSPGLRMMANNAIQKVDKARRELSASTDGGTKDSLPDIKDRTS